MIQAQNAHELAQIAKETGALVLRGQLRYPGPETGDWEIGTESLPEVLYELRNRKVLLILAPVDGGEPVHLCGICGFVSSKPGEPCPCCALIDDEVATPIDGKRLASLQRIRIRASRHMPLVRQNDGLQPGER